MAITRVELNANRLRLRRDNRQLRASRRDHRYLEGDTLANASADTLQTPNTVPPVVDGQPSETSSDSGPIREISPGSRHRIDSHQSGTDSKLYDLKAVISGAPTPNSDQHTPVLDRSDENVDLKETSGKPVDAKTTETPVDAIAAVETSAVEGGAATQIAAEKTVAKETPKQPAPNAAATAPSPAPPASAVDPKVGQSRLDLITGEWTWFATTRSQRPDQYGNVLVQPAKEIDCPFCAGEEHRTPNPVWVASIDEKSDPHDSQSATSTENAPDWAVRVVPNLYPAVTRLEDAGVHTPPDQDVSDQQAEKEAMPASARIHRSGGTFTSYSHAQAIFREGRKPTPSSPAAKLFPCEPAMGGHEVIIEAPRHTESLGELNTSEIALVFAAYADRIRYWRSVPGVRHVSIFKNVGRDAGASLQHSHSQLIATNRVPALVQQVTRRLQAHHARVGSCLQCDLIRGEMDEKSRIVSQTDSFVAYCPFASRFPMQVRLTSKEHLSCISELHERPLAELARLSLRVVRWLEALRPRTAYNVLVHTCPVDFQGAKESQHWAIDIFPRVSRLAGFELATGAMINPIYPETAAKAYRAQARLSDPRYVLR
ncbi:galactose-1-phosphate uridylyltransferase [Aporhodopirellula aestuarii]|uniref:DUF4921 family protein n=1 Tax=Aporhodopirellula aestuarii TaxID=2950107 RepID=A0ABT0TXC3_9BACT|nr:DUF4921 family protein [Aporhodopirellula aestuarii]MCM2369230.1 DUF4921 family protein [Aporhodopirellula aestuarii]